jgi:tetratricopeptide (TPR) repeat protein
LFRRSALCALLVSLILVSYGFVIERTMEPVVARLSAVPPGSPEGTASAGVSIQRDHVVVRYRLAEGGLATFVLRHPSVAEDTDVVVGPFAVGSSLPTDHPLAAAVLDRVRQLGADFRWSGARELLERALSRLTMLDNASATDLVRQAIRIQPDDPRTLFIGAAILRAAKDQEAAEVLEKQVQGVLEREGGEPSVAPVVLRYLRGDRKPDWKPLLEGSAAVPCDVLALAEVAFILGDEAFALVLCDAILPLDPLCKAAWSLAAEIENRGGRWADLDRRMLKALEWFPHDDGFLSRRSSALRGLGRMDEARDLLEPVVRRDPLRSGPLGSLAHLYTATLLTEDGFQQMEARYRADPADVVSGFLSGVYAHYLAHHERCVEIMMSLRDKLPNQPRVTMYAAVSSFLLGRQADAERLVEEAVGIAEARDPDVYYCRAMIRRKLDPVAAAADLEMFLEVAKNGWVPEEKMVKVRRDIKYLKQGKEPPLTEPHHVSPDGRGTMVDGRLGGGRGRGSGLGDDVGLDVGEEPSSSAMLAAGSEGQRWGAGLPSAHRPLDLPEWITHAELWVSALLLLLSLLALPAAFRRSWRWLTDSAGSRYRLVLVVTLGVIALVQILVPTVLVMVFGGYASVLEAWAFRPVDKYGAASTVLYGPLLWLLGPGTDVLVWTNRLLGVALLPLVGAWAVRLSSRRLAGLTAIVLCGLAPALLRDRASEGLMVMVTFWMMMSVMHLDAWLENRGSRLHLLGWVAASAFAMNGRPECFVVLPLLWGSVLLVEQRYRALQGRVPQCAGALILMGVLVVPRLLSLFAYVEGALDHGELVGMPGGNVEGILEDLWRKNALLTPWILNPLVSLLGVAAVFVVGFGKRMSVGLVWLAILAWLVLSASDLPPVSVPRLQAFAMLLTLVLAACTLAAGLSMAGRKVPAASAVVLVLAMLPMPGSLSTLWQPTNAGLFDEFWREAIDAVPEDTTTTRCLVALSMSDSPRSPVMRNYPLYEVAVRSGRVEQYAIQTFRERQLGILNGRCEVLYIEGPQCYAAEYDLADGQPGELGPTHPACVAMRSEFELEDIHTADAENAGNTDYAVYGPSSTLRYGLYRVKSTR